MKARPILFSGPMVKALLEGRKTQTRRIIEIPDDSVTLWSDPGLGGGEYLKTGDKDGIVRRLRCPYGAVGDLLWVRERIELIDAGSGSCVGQGFGFNVRYKADGKEEWCWATKEALPKSLGTKPSIHMNKWASRLTLEIIGVRVELLQDTSESDALAEGIIQLNEHEFHCPGIEHPNKHFPRLSRGNAREMYAALWDTINGSGAWLGNPWVWVIEFKVHQCNVDKFMRGSDHA